jgi:hypothetical protein
LHALNQRRLDDGAQHKRSTGEFNQRRVMTEG